MSRYGPWSERLAQIRVAGRHRTLRTLTPTGPCTALLDGAEVIVACSNDYLGLAWALQSEGGGGAAGSRLISGDRPEHQAVEQLLEGVFGRPALLFPSGYHANLAVFSTVVGPEHTVASDALNHASIIDGLRLGRARRVIAPHGQPPEGAVDLVVVEGLFSMDGDRVPLSRYPTGPWLAVDEAHAVGALGPHGRGEAARQGIEPDILIGTLGKAYGSAGAFVVGPPELKELLVNAARSFIFTTGLHPAAARAALVGIERADDALRERLAANARRLRGGLSALGWAPLGDAHIVPVVVGSEVMRLAQRLLDRGVYAPGIRWPTVPRGQERIRFTVSAAHTEDQIDRIIEAMGPKSG